MTGIQGIIFDLDGVLISTDAFHYAAWKVLADELGAPFDEKINDRLRGVSRMESLEIILGNAGITLPEARKERLASEKNERYRALLRQLSPLSVSPDVRETLAALRARGRKLAIGSSSKNANMILERTDLIGFFDAVSDGNNITRSKPDPEVFLKAAAFIGLSPKECAVVEDAEAGIDAAKAGGFFAIGIGGAKDYAKTDQGIRKLSELTAL